MTDRPEQASPGTPGADDPTSDWKAVESPSAPAKPPMPAAVKFGGLALLAVLLVGAVLAGIALGGGFAKGPEPSAPPTPTPSFSLSAPVQVGEFVRGDVKESTGPAPANQRIVRADYSDGTDSVVLLMAWPEDDVDSFLSDAGIDTASLESSPSPAVPQGTRCGTSLDSSLPACGRIVDDTGLLVVALTEQTTEEINALLGEFEQAVAA